MQTLVHTITFICSVAIVWFFAGILIESVSRLALYFRKTGFITAFFILGFLTSVGEISVAVNAGIAGVPEVSVGNLIGASLVILLFIIPVLAIASGSVTLRGSVSSRNLSMMLALVLLPTLLVLDGNVTRAEGFLAILAYGTVAYALYRTRGTESFMVHKIHARETRVMPDIGRIVLAGGAIFLATHFLVRQAVYFATILSVPASLVGLLLLSIGTNLPEIVIALRSIVRKRTDIAFGDYLGSAAMNTLIFGGLAVTHGAFMLEQSEFVATGVLMAVGFLLLFLFARSKHELSRTEGIFLFIFYIAFVVVQSVNVARFVGE